ncbi:hypothetical protein SAMN05444354_1048 [Stigmatella aurantiaca]|uniref:Uncharacterized protein n=1 Tax=Stigmatella aurantiaca TaxID=41 RepID=A0A1H7MJ80_STIAU|nr:hypothetical protein [Stigmatella aurantiaca]SEL11252.1 hypothetical protein SAMN05444354_1048 [Stigmatella aurantiaca]
MGARAAGVVGPALAARLPEREPLTPCRECGKVLPYACATPLCDDCLSQPTFAEIQRQADAMAARWGQARAESEDLRTILEAERRKHAETEARADGLRLQVTKDLEHELRQETRVLALNRALMAARAETKAASIKGEAERVVLTASLRRWEDRCRRAVLELRRRRQHHTELMGYVGLLKQAQRKAQRNLAAADVAVLRRFDEARAYCRELEHERRERTRQQERADELHRRLETAERDRDATAEALHSALRERDALDKERTRLAVELEVVGERFGDIAEDLRCVPNGAAAADESEDIK